MNRFLSSAVSTVSFPRLMATLSSIYAFYTGSVVFGIIACVMVLAGEVITRMLSIQAVNIRVDSELVQIKTDLNNIKRSLTAMADNDRSY